MTHSVRLSRAARNDLAEIALWITERADTDTARSYVARIESACRKLSDFAERGRTREEYGAGIRSLAFERRATIFYRLSGESITILHIVHHGRDSTHIFDPDDGAA